MTEFPDTAMEMPIRAPDPIVRVLVEERLRGAALRVGATEEELETALRVVGLR